MLNMPNECGSGEKESAEENGGRKKRHTGKFTLSVAQFIDLIFKSTEVKGLI